MSPQEFRSLCDLLKQESGLVLNEDKRYLVENRLMPVVRRHNLRDLGELARSVRATSGGALLREVTEAMTTNESFFFRDIKPFDQFRDVVLSRLLEARAASRAIRIWSAACSSGQEPYSLAMILRERAAKLSGWQVEIVATDISRDILEKAKAGMYSQFEVQRGLPVQYLVKYFSQVEERWQIDSAIRAMVRFRYFNLLDNLTALGTYDVVYCRNVLIYFDQDTKRRVLEGIRAQLRPGGYLFLGGAETVLGISDSFSPVPGQRGIYEAVEAAARPMARATA